MGTFKAPSTLDELAKHPQKPSKDMYEKLEKLELKEPQVLSCKWVDEEGVTLGVYFSWSKKPKEWKTADQREGQEGSKATQNTQAVSKVSHFESLWQISAHMSHRRRRKEKAKKKQTQVPPTTPKVAYMALS